MNTPRIFSPLRWTLILIFLVPFHPMSAVSIGSSEVSPGNYTQMDVGLLIAYILVALVFSFLCSVAEAVLLSITPSYIAGLQEKSTKLAKQLKRLKQDEVDKSLAAILTLNTIAHTVGAIGSGAKATIVFGSAWFGVFSAVMTLLILFLSEIIPKTLGAVYWRNLTRPTAFFVQTLIRILYPLIVVSEWLTKLIARNKGIHPFSREEFVALADIGKKAGQINERESRIISNLFRFNSLKAKDVMTPRTVVMALQENHSVAEALKANSNTPFSRIPLFTEDLDDCCSFILKDDMLLSNARGQGDVKLKTLKRPILTIPNETSLSNLLEFFLTERQHLTLVVGEYGGTVGLVTLEDVVETLLGMEIVDEMDKVEDMQNLARKQWEKRAKRLGLDV